MGTESAAALGPVSYTHLDVYKRQEYKWIHYDLERMTPSQLDYLRQLPKSVFFTLDGWAYMMEHQYKFGTYETIENTAQFTAYWKEHAPQELSLIHILRGAFWNHSMTGPGAMP